MVRWAAPLVGEPLQIPVVRVDPDHPGVTAEHADRYLDAFAQMMELEKSDAKAAAGAAGIPHPAGVLLWKGLEDDMAGWTVSIGFVLVDGEPVERLVNFYNDGSATQVSRAQRELRIGEALRAVRQIADELPGLFEDWTALRTRRRGRAGSPDAIYAHWASLRVEAEGLSREQRGGKSVLAFLADREHVSLGSVKQYMQRARDRGLLTSGNEPTQYAQDLLARASAHKNLEV